MRPAISKRALGGLVLDVEVPQVERVHGGGHPGAVGVPREDVERGWLLAHQPVGHHVVEDQVVGPQDVERARHRGTLERALAAHLALQLLHRREVGERAERAGLRVVEHRVDQGEGADPAVARLLQVRGRDGGQRTAEAQPHDVDRLRAGDVADDVERGLRAVDEVVVHRGGRHVGGRVDVADGEHGAPVLDGPLDEAAARRQVHHVVLVDPRRARQQRGGVHLLGLRLVLQQLHEVVAEHHLRGRDGEVAAHLEAAGVDLARTAAVVAHVVEELPRARDEAPPTRVERPLERGGVRRQEVGG